MGNKWKAYRYFVLFSVLDAISTWYLIASGIGSEGNLFFKVFGESWYAMGVFKVGCVAFFGLMIHILKDDYEAQKMAFLANVVMLGVVIWNVSLIFS